MSWTIACFCGNVYTAPPDRCDTCGSTLDPAGGRHGGPFYGFVELQPAARAPASARDLDGSRPQA
jgi:hypothetical protein